MSIQLYNKDCLELMGTLGDSSIDIICIDPPYLYLKGQKLERPFDELLFFSECKRLLTKDGFIVMFGRGESFYRWNTILADLGLKFKEEIVWDKSYCTSPLMAISRVHETVSIFTKGKGTLKKVKIPYLEMKTRDVESIIQDVKRLRTILKNPRSLQAVEEFLENNRLVNTTPRKHNTSVPVQPSTQQNIGRSPDIVSAIQDGLNEKTIVRTDYNHQSKTDKYVTKGEIKNGDKAVDAMQSISFGLNEKTIIRTDFYQSSSFAKAGVTTDTKSAGDGDRCVKVINSIEHGMSEKTIIRQARDHYSAIHPTQKPVRLLERLLALVLPNKPRNEITVADFFGGSFSTMETCHNMELNGISCEIDEEYFNAGKQRIDSLKPVMRDLFGNLVA